MTKPEVRKIKNEKAKTAMKFQVSRTSAHLMKPCEEAVECGESSWAVEISSLEALIAFCQKYEGRLVIHCPTKPKNEENWEDREPIPLSATVLPEIEIYDDHRE